MLIDLVCLEIDINFNCYVVELFCFNEIINNLNIDFEVWKGVVIGIIVVIFIVIIIIVVVCIYWKRCKLNLKNGKVKGKK